MILIEENKEPTVDVREYDLKYFEQSDKAIWTNTRRDTPDVRLPSIYGKMFLPKSAIFIDNKGKRLFISDFLMNKIVSKYKRKYPGHRNSLPPNPKIHTVSVTRWNNAKGKST